MVAARAAVADANLEISEEIAPQVAAVLGNAGGGQNSVDDSYYQLYGQNSQRMHPLTIPRWMVNAAVSQVSMDLGIKGPAFTVATACASATHAIGQAFNLVRTGQAPVAIAGGTEASLTVGTIKSWEALRMLSPDTCRPFSKTRSGLVLGEGAAIVVLEARERAQARGARIYAELLGFGMSSDASDIIAIDADGAARAMRAALADAKLNPEDIDYVNAHGTGTTLNDRAETIALRKAFGASAERLAISSCKAVLGHSLGAAGALEFVATALALDRPDHPANRQLRGSRPGLRSRFRSQRRSQSIDPECGVKLIRIWWIECGPGARACLIGLSPGRVLTPIAAWRFLQSWPTPAGCEQTKVRHAQRRRRLDGACRRSAIALPQPVFQHQLEARRHLACLISN